ncbi:MAG: glycosyltransferase [Anaerolineae bacterium]
MAVPVLYVIHEMADKTAARQLQELVLHLDPIFRPIVCSLGARPTFAALAETGVAVQRLPQHRAGDRVWGLAGLVRSCRPHIVHAFGARGHLWATPLARTLKVRVALYSGHSSARDRKGSRWLQRLNGFASRLDDVVVAPSQAQALRLLREGCSTPAKVRVIPDGVDLSRYHPSADGRLRAALGLSEHVPIVASVIEFAAQGAGDDLFEAAQALVRLGVACQFVCAGDGPQRPTAEARVRSLGLERRFSFLGRCADVPALLAAADVVFLPSCGGDSPGLVLGAMASGRPVVCSAAGAYAEAVLEGQTGYLVPPGHIARLAGALARALGEAGRRRAAQQFDAQVSLRRMQQLYLDLLAQKRS